MTWFAEYTDTFGGEANYSWVRRAHIGCLDSDAIARTGRCESRSAIMRRAKAAVGISGLRGRTTDHGDMLEFRPWRMCTVLFVTWNDSATDEEIVGWEGN